METKEAVLVLIKEARSERRVSTASGKRATSALRTLGLHSAELIEILCYLDICKEDGTPWSLKAKRSW